MNDMTLRKAMTALDKIRTKIAADALAAQQPKPVRHIETAPRRLPEKPKHSIEYPKSIRFPTFFRTFKSVTFADYSNFVRLTDGSGWKLEKIVYPDSRIKIDVPAYLKSTGEPFPYFIELESEDGKSFTSGELFYKIHKALIEPSTHDFFCLRGAKLSVSPFQYTGSNDMSHVYGFYSSHEWALTEPRRI